MLGLHSPCSPQLAFVRGRVVPFEQNEDEDGADEDDHPEGDNQGDKRRGGSVDFRNFCGTADSLLLWARHKGSKSSLLADKVETHRLRRQVAEQHGRLFGSYKGHRNFREDDERKKQREQKVRASSRSGKE